MKRPFKIECSVVNSIKLFSTLIFQANSFYRWAEIFIQTNSLVNPALFFYRNNRYRKAALKLLKFGKPPEIQPVVRMEHRARRHRDPGDCIDVGELIDSERAPRLFFKQILFTDGQKFSSR